MTRAENITPSILVWARDTAGLSVESAGAEQHWILANPGVRTE